MTARPHAAQSAETGRRRPPRLILVPAVAALYLTAGCAGFWDQPVNKGQPKDYLFRTATTTTPPAGTPARPTTSHPTYLPTPAPATSTPVPTVEYAAVCVDPTTNTRVDDEDCTDARTDIYESDTLAHTDSNGTILYWYYLDLRTVRTAPTVGTVVTGGTYITPRTSDDRIQRGGFGGTSTGTVAS